MKTIAEINAIKEKMQAQIVNRNNKDEKVETRIVVGMATCGIAAGARPVFNELVEEVQKRNLTNVKVSRTGCMGMCKLEPIVEVYVPNEPKVTYILVDAEKAKKIIAQHIVAGRVCTEFLPSDEI